LHVTHCPEDGVAGGWHAVQYVLGPEQFKQGGVHAVHTVLSKKNPASQLEHPLELQIKQLFEQFTHLCPEI
jgi:hypothetical protein